MKKSPEKTAFVLLLTLVLIIVAGAALAGVARMSIEGALESRDAADELKRRWAIISSRKALLGRVDSLFETVERGDAEKGYANKPIRQLRLNCQLANVDYEFVFFDEQAKLNVNQYFAKNSTSQTLIAVKMLTRSGIRVDKDIDTKLRPFIAKMSDDGVQGFSKFNSYGQLFDNASPADYLGGPSCSGLADMITCWGDGKINLRRVPAEVVELRCKKIFGLGFTRKLIAARNSEPYAALEDFLKKIKADSKQEVKAREILTTQSNCYSMWTITHGKQRDWHDLVICVLGGQTQQDANGETPEARDVMCEYIFSW